MLKNTGFRNGFVEITMLVVTSILIIMTIPFISRVVTEYKLMAKIYKSTAALDLAEAGIERALWELNYNSSTFSGWTSSTQGTVTTRIIDCNSFQAAGSTVIGDYTVSVVTDSSIPTEATITCTGYVPSRTDTDKSIRQVRITCAKSNFSKAVLALNGITMSGQATTDSYDSALGPYSGQTPTQNGDIATNGSITLGSNTYVNGDANPGPDYPFTSTPPVSGSYGTLQAPFTVDPIPQSTLDSARLNNNNSAITITDKFGEVTQFTGTVISLSSEVTMTIPAGTYYFTSITTTGQALINVSGAASIYVEGGNINIEGQGLVNTSPDGRPRNLLLYSTGSTIKLAGQAAFAGAIYAPNATVQLIGQEQLYGSIVCGSNVDSGQAKIHYDLDLANVYPVFAANRVTSWQEIKQ